VLGPRNVWVFGLDAGPYAAHFNGRRWAKARLPTTLARVRRAEVGQLHWKGSSWRPVGAGAPAGVIDSVAPDGSGGLWATGVDVSGKGRHGVIIKYGP